MIYDYGPRVDEATPLTLADLDFKNHRIRIRRLKNGLGGLGATADLVLWKAASWAMTPLRDPVKNIVYNATADDIALADLQPAASACGRA